MGQYDWLQLALDFVAVLPRQHIHLPLVHTQLTDVCLQAPRFLIITASLLKRHGLPVLPSHLLITVPPEMQACTHSPILPI